MNEAEAWLTGQIFALTRSELDNTSVSCAPFYRVADLLGAMRPVRIESMAGFWRKQDNEERLALKQSVEDLVAGWYGQSRTWVFAIWGKPGHIECGYAVAAPIEDASLAPTLAGVFPGAGLVEEWPVIGNGWQPMDEQAVAITGVPSSKAEQIEKVCRGLFGCEWLYLIYAHPHPTAEVRKGLIDIDRAVSKAQQEYLHQDAPPIRVAQQYVNLLERQGKRLESGRAGGLWNTYAMLAVRNDPAALERARGLLQSAYSGEASSPEPLRVRRFGREAAAKGVVNTWTLLTTSEVAALGRPPREEYPGYEVAESVRFGVKPGAAPGPGTEGVEVGEVLDRERPTGNVLRVARKDLTKHGLIVGVTGSGKTNTCFELLAQVWQEGRGVPFLVLEPAKSEYRDLLNDRRFKGLRIFTVGDETVSPLRLNPFEVPPGILVQSHIDYLKSLFAAAFVLYPPMPYVLEQALQEVYEDRGWDLGANFNPRGMGTRLFPTLDDLIARVRAVVDRLGYDTRLTMDIQAGLVARLDGLRKGGGKGPMLNTHQSIDAGVLFASPCILELKQIVSDDEKAFVMGLLLIRLYEFYEGGQGGSPTGELCHVTLIEEAHRLLRNVSTEQGSDVSANPKGRAVEVFGNILSEIRAYGEGILIAEQVPVKLLPDAIKNTNLKIVHRLVASDDRDLVGKTMNLSETQTRHLSTLRTGQAVVYTEGMLKPVLLQVGLAPTKRSGGRVGSAQITQAMSGFFMERPRLLYPFAACGICPRKASGGRCGARDGNPALRTAFVPLFNAIRFGHASMGDAHAQFTAAYRRLAAYLKDKTSAHCLFVGMANEEMQRRSEFYGWQCNETDKLFDSVCLAFHYLSIGSADEAQLQSVSTDFKQLQNLEHLPFVGCAHCTSRCAFGFDMAEPLSKDFQSAYRATMEKPKEEFKKSWDELVVGHALEHSTKHFTETDVQSLQNAAFCFGVQQFHRFQMSSALRDLATATLAKSLAKRPRL